jgi:endoglucanase
MLRFILLLFISILSFQTTEAQLYPRYNLAGYPAKAPKSFVLMSDKAMDQNEWTIKSEEGKPLLSKAFGSSIAPAGAHTPKPFNYLIDFSSIRKPGRYFFLQDGQELFSFEIKNNPYQHLLPQMVGYLKSQRSGVAVPPAQKIGHSGDARCRVYQRQNNLNNRWEATPEEKHLDMAGGWYDAGDYLKFTLTTAYTTYFLLRAYETLPAIASNSEIRKQLWEEAEWGLSYLLKTMPDDHTFIIQVGNAEDHKQGSRMPYDDALNGKRHAYSALSTPQMGLTAAALSLGAQLLSSQSGGRSQAAVYRTKATQIYRLATTVASAPTAWFEEGWEKFYSDQSGHDNMELAAVELYRTTQEEKYLEDAILYAGQAGAGWWSSWGNLNMVAHLRLHAYAPSQVERFLQQDLQNFQSIARQRGNIWGLPHAYTWASLYSFLEVGSAALQYAALDIANQPFEKIASDVLDYTLGKNNWGVAMIASPDISPSVQNIYTQKIQLHPEVHLPYGAIAEGPGDKKTHDELKDYFAIPDNHPFEAFNTNEVVFYDHSSDFQCMETTIGGLADALYFFSLVHQKWEKP